MDFAQFVVFFVGLNDKATTDDGSRFLQNEFRRSRFHTPSGGWGGRITGLTVIRETNTFTGLQPA